MHSASLLARRLGNLDEAQRLNGLLLEAVPGHPQASRLRGLLLAEPGAD